MKPFFIFIASCCTVLSVVAQNNISVSITLNGNQNRELIVDGKTYAPEASSSGDQRNSKAIILTDMSPGEHSMQVVKTNLNNNRRNTVVEKTFNLRQGYDLDVIVNGNGTIQLTEKRIRNRNRSTTTVRTPMTTTSFNTILKNVRSQYGNAAKASSVSDVFAATTNHFSTSQVSQLVRMVTGESNRLQLLKSAYATVTDPSNFSTLSTLLASQAGRQELTAYVKAYSPNANIPSSSPGSYHAPMSASNYQMLAAQIQREYDANGRMVATYNVFSNSTNYFSTDQARRLIQLSTGEANMLHLAKASYRSITDKNNFTAIYNLIPTQAGKNELAMYVNNYNPSVVYNGNVSVAPATGVYKTPMSEENFNALLSQIRGQWLPGAKKTAVVRAFSTGDFFTTTQALQLIQLDNDEIDRLEMAKASYKAIADPSNFSQVYNLFSTAGYRDELALYITNYNNGNVTGAVPTPGYNVAMSDGNFSNLLSSIRGQWLPGAKKSAVLTAFASTDYFTTAQAVQLIQLDNDEQDRFDMAKASYKKIVDRNNFNLVYNLFATQSYKNALNAYVNENR